MVFGAGISIGNSLSWRVDQGTIPDELVK